MKYGLRATRAIVTTQTSSVLDRLEDVDRVAQNQRFILIADARRKNEVGGLTQSGWDVWDGLPGILAGTSPAIAERRSSGGSSRPRTASLRASQRS
jgi:hypothetical protein